jgi:hypothetical protein
MPDVALERLDQCPTVPVSLSRDDLAQPETLSPVLGSEYITDDHPSDAAKTKAIRIALAGMLFLGTLWQAKALPRGVSRAFATGARRLNHQVVQR